MPKFKLEMFTPKKQFFVGDGFMEVRPDDVLVFTHLLEWREDIDEAKAQLLLEQEKEQLRNAASFSEHRRTEIELQRMMTTLRKRNYNLNI